MVQASSCQLAVIQERFFCTVEAKQESRRINYNNSASDLLEWTVRIQPDEKTLPIFFLSSRFRNNSASFCDKSLQRHPFWMTPSNLLCNWRLKLELLNQPVI